MRSLQRYLPALAACLILFSPAFPAEASDWPTGTYVYQIRKGANPIGVQVVTSGERGGSFTVEVDEFVRATSYCHHSLRTEVWQGGRLISFVSLTAGKCGLLASVFRPWRCRWRGDGLPHRVEAVSEGGVLRVSGPSGMREGTPSLIPLNPFNPHLRGFERETEVLTAREGVTRKAWITFIGEENIELGDGSVRKALRYRYRDDRWFRELWYDERGLWLRMFIPEDVTFTLLPGADPADHAPPPDVDPRCLLPEE
jgi:hypothetical protein